MLSYSVIKGPTVFDENEKFVLQFDGLAEPNPGEITAGAILLTPFDRRILLEKGEYVGTGTNNQAEYNGLICGLKAAIDMGIKELLIEGDSQLVIFQTQGKWKVKNDNIKALHKEAVELIMKHFTFVASRHISRDKNTLADIVTNNVIKTKQSYFKMR